MNKNKTMVWLALIGIALTSCDKKPVAETSTTPERVAPATPEPHLVAPAGVFFLVQKATMETDSGVLSYRPGAKLYRAGGRYVTGDGHQLTLRPEQVTNNLQLAQRAAGGDAKAQAIIAATVQTARAFQSATPAAPPNSTASVAGSEISASYAKPATLKSSEAEGRKFDNSRKNKK